MIAYILWLRPSLRRSAVPGRVAALEKSELKSSIETGNRDGDIILRKIKAFLDEKNLPQEKRDMIVRTLQNTLTTDNINKVENGESQLKRVFAKIVDDLGIYYKIGLTTDLPVSYSMRCIAGWAFLKTS